MCARLMPLLLCFVLVAANAADAKPNIVFVLADDLGWNDIGYHNPEVLTPNLDRISRNAVRLNNFHVSPMCTPTRAAFMTGKPASMVGLSDSVLSPWSKQGLGLDEVTVAQRLQRLGYFTAIIGKWNLGHYQREYLPLQRGFDYQFGPYSAEVEYSSHTIPTTDVPDLFRQEQPVRVEGYLTTLLGQEAAELIRKHDFAQPLFIYLPFTAPHKPFEASYRDHARLVHIKDPKRRIYLAMVLSLDRAIGEVIRALQKKGEWQNTLFVFASDNGGELDEGNDPLQGGKKTCFEGGIRTPALLSYPDRLKSSGGQVDNHAFKVTDLTETFARAAGESAKARIAGTDGVDILAVLQGEETVPHFRILHLDTRCAAFLYGDLKAMINPERRADVPDSNLFPVTIHHLLNDPGERVDLAVQNPALVARFMQDVQRFRAESPAPVVGREEWNQPIRWITIPTADWLNGNLAKLQHALKALFFRHPELKLQLMLAVAGLLMLLAVWFVWWRRR